MVSCALVVVLVFNVILPVAMPSGGMAAEFSDTVKLPVYLRVLGEIVTADDGGLGIGCVEHADRGTGELGHRIGRVLQDHPKIELCHDLAAHPLEGRAAPPLSLGLSTRGAFGVLEQLLGTATPFSVPSRSSSPMVSFPPRPIRWNV